MKKALLLGAVFCLGCGLLLHAGFAETSASVSDVIKNSQSLNGLVEKAGYLIKQAEVLYKAKEFQKAIEVAQYLLNNVDKDSQPAKSLIEKAKAALQGTAQQAVGGMSNKLLGK